MADCEHEGRGAGEAIPSGELKSVLVLGILRIRDRVVHVYQRAKGLELSHHIDDPRVADVGAILLEGESKDDDVLPAYRESGLDEMLDCLLGHIFAHAVVDASPR